MEEKKKARPLAVIAWVLLGLLLAVACFGAAGERGDLSFGKGPWGIYATDSNTSYLDEAYYQYTTLRKDLLITDRRATMQDGALVIYELDGRRTVDIYDDLLGQPRLYSMAQVKATAPEAVVLHVPMLGSVVRQLHTFRYGIWGVSAGLVLFGLVMRLTARSRWRRRQQKLMRKSFETFGEKYRQEDEDITY